MEVIIKKTTDRKILEECALLMSTSEPWKTLKRDLAGCIAALQGDYKEVYIATDHENLIGFAVLQMAGSFKGYIQSILVIDHYRGKGIGSLLLDFCEKRIFQVSPNVFMCVSSFNTEAAKLYKRLGYETIGELKDFVVSGHSEILLRKTIAPLSAFNP